MLPAPVSSHMAEDAEASEEPREAGVALDSFVKCNAAGLEWLKALLRSARGARRGQNSELHVRWPDGTAPEEGAEGARRSQLNVRCCSV